VGEDLRPHPRCQLGRLKRLGILIARPMSPLIFSLFCMKAEVPSMAPVMIFTQSAESA
jgi:hypothetical protein